MIVQMKFPVVRDLSHFSDIRWRLCICSDDTVLLIWFSRAPLITVSSDVSDTVTAQSVNETRSWMAARQTLRGVEICADWTFAPFALFSRDVSLEGEKRGSYLACIILEPPVKIKEPVCLQLSYTSYLLFVPNMITASNL